MPSDFAVHSDLLVHWTGKDIDEKWPPNHELWWKERFSKNADSAYLERLYNILKFGLWMTPQVAWTAARPGQWAVEIREAAGACFTELKLSQSKNHARRYGHLGIAVKRPFVYNRRGRQMIYINERNDRMDPFFEACSKSTMDPKLMQFFKPMDENREGQMKYGFYDESEWRILEPLNENPSWFVDPKGTSDQATAEYFGRLPEAQQAKLRGLVHLDVWLAAIIYPTIKVKNAAESSKEIQELIQAICKNPADPWFGVEKGNLPVQMDLDLCANF
jgi:hypothetical protein